MVENTSVFQEYAIEFNTNWLDSKMKAGHHSQPNTVASPQFDKI